MNYERDLPTVSVFQHFCKGIDPYEYIRYDPPFLSSACKITGSADQKTKLLKNHVNAFQKSVKEVFNGNL